MNWDENGMNPTAHHSSPSSLQGMWHCPVTMSLQWQPKHWDFGGFRLQPCHPPHALDIAKDNGLGRI